MDNQKLMECLNFDDGDLQANRSGNFSEKQKKDLQQKRITAKNRPLKNGRNAIILGLVIPFLILVLDGLISIVNHQPLHLDLGGMISAGVVFVIFIGVGLLFLSAANSISTDISGEQVKKVEGAVKIVKEESSTTSNGFVHRDYWDELYIGDDSFTAPDELRHIIMKGDVYTVYYIDSDDTILSMEFVAKGA
ncbi:MAG: hypothetical protein WCE68_11385 [Anaerolineales bacterium]